MELTQLLSELRAKNGSDLHLLVGLPPMARLISEVLPLGTYPPLDDKTMEALFAPYIPEAEKAGLQKVQRANFGRSMPDGSRYRFNLCMAMGKVSATVRALPARIPPLSALGLPPVAATLAQKRNGLVLVTGPTGSGKSTTLAAMLEHVNQNGPPSKIITIEDPIENLIKPQRCLVMQREVGTDVPSFEDGTLDSLRQDPDIICIGEMRGAKSIEAALLAAETGHLVLTTLHTRDAAKTAQRIITGVGTHDQDSVREQLALTIEAVLSQELVPRADKKGRIMVADIMLATPAIRQLIRENRLEAINDAILAGGNIGMVSRDHWLMSLVQKGIITREIALPRMRNPTMLGR